MSEYGSSTTQRPTPLLSYDSVQEAKAARKKLLERIEQRRRENYKRFMEKKRQLHAEDDLL